MTEPSEEVTTPSSDLWAVVRHADPPELVPDELLAYVVPRYADDRLVDWTLTGDVIAFGDVDVPTAYQRWRASWERAWPLDPESNVIRLTAIARELAGDIGLGSRALLDLAPGDGHPHRRVEEPDELLHLASDVERLRDAIRDRGRTGFGFVDVTEGRQRVGLARAWSASGGPELLAADPALTATMVPGVGLRVELASPSTSTLDGVQEVAVQTSGVDVTVVDGAVTRLGLEQATALTWIVPGSARWRVREIPEVLVWARTFGGLPEACRYAAALRHPMTIGLGTT